jgi:hypothetical protein
MNPCREGIADKLLKRQFERPPIAELPTETERKILIRQIEVQESTLTKVGKKKIRTLWHMPKVYGKFMGPTLQEAIAAQLEQDPKEQLQLYEEIALMRQAAGEAVKLYSVALAANESEPSDKRQGMVLQAATIMQQSLNEVVRICESASRIEANAKDKISITNLSFFVDQLVRITYNTLGGDDVGQAQCAQLEQALRAQIRIPLQQGTLIGTTVTPDSTDAIVADMDSTIPSSDVDVLPKLVG